ncbi:MAG TPA: HAD family phosphatase [Actinomycetota bacterium]|nr:HAD family phosphatase [Actinomycetota bacterium]
MPPFSALIVDYGGVLTTPIQDSMMVFASELGIELQDLARVALKAYVDGDDDLVTSFETGRISEEEFSKAFAERLSQATGRAIEPHGFVRRMFGNSTLEERMLEAVARIRDEGFKTALLSNSWGLQGYPRDRFGGLFDEVVISGEVGLRKPDPAIFEMTVDRLDVSIEECVFVDDHPGHLKAALAAGMTTVLHRSPDETLPELERLFDIEL